jgi:predicted RNase H-like nuclease
MLLLGIDLAWGRAGGARRPNESGVAAIDDVGRVVNAGWTANLRATKAWIGGFSEADILLFVDAPLVVQNPTGMRLCEKRVGQCYGTYGVSANATNQSSVGLDGVSLRRSLVRSGWQYSDGASGPPKAGRWFSECYPFTTLVGAKEFGYGYRPPYKRRPAGVTYAQRAATCNVLIQRLSRLRTKAPPLDLLSHPNTASLVRRPAPTNRRAYKHREDLIDAVICAWTAALWRQFGFARCQVLGLVSPSKGLHATIIAPFQPEQRGSVSS